MRYEAVVETVDSVDSDLTEPLEIRFQDPRRGVRHRVALDQFTGGHLLHLAVAGCVFNDLHREARQRGITLTHVSVTADGGFDGTPTESTGIEYSIEVAGTASEQELNELVTYVEEIAEIPSAIRAGAAVRLTRKIVATTS